MYRSLGFIGLIALIGCNDKPPAPNATTPATVSSTLGESGGRAYILLDPNMT